MDASVLGQGLVGVAAIGGIAWAAWERFQKGRAQLSADIATSDASRTVADAQATVYGLVTQRLAALEEEVKGLRNELAVERAHSRKLELHIWKLEGMMRKANLDPTLFDTAAQ